MIGYRRRRLLVGALVLGCGACSGSSAGQAEKDATTLHSWAAATTMALDAWSAGRAPTPYASKTIEVAQDEVERVTRSLLEEGPRPGAGAAALSLAQHLVLAQSALEGSDRGAAAAAARLLSADDSALARLERSLKAVAP